MQIHKLKLLLVLLFLSVNRFIMADSLSVSCGFLWNSDYSLSLAGQSSSGYYVDYWNDGAGGPGYGPRLTVTGEFKMGQVYYGHAHCASGPPDNGIVASDISYSGPFCVSACVTGCGWKSGPLPLDVDMTIMLYDNGQRQPVAIWDKSSIPADGIATATALVVGTSYPVTFSLISGPPDCTLSNEPSLNQATLQAGTTPGTAYVYAQTDDPSECLDRYLSIEIGCSACAAGGVCTSPNTGLSSVDIRLPLGPSIKGAGAFLQVESATPSPDLGSPKSLQCNFIRPELEIFTNSSGWLQQVRAADRIIDIITNSESSYSLNYYNPADSAWATNGFYVFATYKWMTNANYLVTNSPFETVTIELVNGDTNHLRLTDSLNPAQSDYFWVNNGWSLVTGNGLRNETLSVVTNGTVYTKFRVIQDAQGTTDYQSVETWQIFPYGDRMIQKVVGSGPAAQTESYAYDDGGRVQQANHSDGSWDIYTYDSMGRQTGHYTPFLNSSPTTNASLCRFIAYTYDDSVLAGSADDPTLESTTPRQVINYVLGQEISRSYTVVQSGERDQIQCVNPGWHGTTQAISLPSTTCLRILLILASRP